MKKNYLLFAAALSTMLPVSCMKESSGPQQTSIEIEFTTNDLESADTKSSSTAVLGLSNGCTVAFYSQSSGTLQTTGSCTGSTNKIIITDVPPMNCNVYAVGNTTFSWPQSESSLTSTGISIDVTSGYIPRSTREDEYTWSVGTSTMTIDMKKMYSTIKIRRNQPEGTTFTAKSARIVNCPETIYPFGASSAGTSGSNDTACSADITLFNSGNEFTLYVPSEGQSKVEVKGVRKIGTGINYEDTYTITVPAIDREGTSSKTVLVNGTTGGDDNVIVVIFEDDTRSVIFGTDVLDAEGDGTAHSTTVKGTATNGETGWTYDISWEGDSSLEGNTTISINGTTASLGTAGSVTDIPGDGNNKDITVTSTYAGDTEKTVRLTSSINSSYMDVTVSKTTKVLTSITATYTKNNTSYNYLYNIDYLASCYGTVVLTARYSDGSTENISGKTATEGLTISMTNYVNYDKYSGYIIFYPREKSFGGTTNITFSYTKDGVTKTTTVNNVKYGPIIEKFRFVVENGLYTKTVKTKSTNIFQWDNPTGYAGGISYIDMDVPSTYTGAAFKVYAVNLEDEEEEIFSGYVNTLGGTGTGSIKSSGYHGYYYDFNGYYDYGEGYCYFNY